MSGIHRFGRLGFFSLTTKIAMTIATQATLSKEVGS
jgi:hypothetical protein